MYSDDDCKDVNSDNINYDEAEDPGDNKIITIQYK